MSNREPMKVDPTVREWCVRMEAEQTDLFRTLLQRCCSVAEGSPDTSTKNGALLICESDHTFYHCNTFSCDDAPGSILSDEDRRAREAWYLEDRDRKLRNIEHAERNAIFYAVRCGKSPVNGVLVCPYAACPDCARAIVLCGVRKLVRLPATAFGGLENNPWKAGIIEADRIMRDAGVKVVDYDGPPLGCKMLVNKTEWEV